MYAFTWAKGALVLHIDPLRVVFLYCFYSGFIGTGRTIIRYRLRHRNLSLRCIICVFLLSVVFRRHRRLYLLVTASCGYELWALCLWNTKHAMMSFHNVFELFPSPTE